MLWPSPDDGTDAISAEQSSLYHGWRPAHVTAEIVTV